MFTSGATLEYIGDGNITTSAVEFPLTNGPTNVIVNTFNPVLQLGASRVITGSLTAPMPIFLGDNNFTASSATGAVITNGSGKLYITNVGAGPVTFPVSPSLGVNNPVTISNGQGLSYGVRVAQGHTPTLSASNNAVNRTWYIEPSANTGTTPVNVSFGYANTHGNAGFNYTNPVDLLQYRGIINAWTVHQANINQTQPLATQISGLNAGESASFTIANAGAVANDQFMWNNGSTTNLWYNAVNWTPNNGPAGWNPSSVAMFQEGGTRTVGIDFSQGNLALKGIRNYAYAGNNVTIGNSSSTPGILQVGYLLSSSTAGGATLTFTNNVMGGTGGMEIALQNSISISGTYGSVIFDCNLTGIGKGLTVGSTGRAELKGANTYTGDTYVYGTAASFNSSLILSHPGGGTLPATNNVRIGDYAALIVKTDQTLRKVEIGYNSGITVDNATLTITDSLIIGNGGITLIGTGKIKYAPGATLKYTASAASTSSGGFPVVDGPTNVVVATFSPFVLHASRVIPGTLTVSSPFWLGDNNFTTSALSATIAVVTNGTGKLYITNIGATPVTFLVGTTSGLVNPVTISNGQGLTYGVRVAQGHTPALSVSNNAVNRT